MSSTKLIAAFAVVLAFLTAAPAQGRMTGRAVAVTDGKTMVIDVDGRTLTAVIQFIEVPEPEQPLHNVVRDHLAKLVVGRIVEFAPAGIQPGKTVGTISAGGSDIGRQLVRDGAAWHAPPDKSGQPRADAEAYRANEAAAKAEKRGVWGVAGMKPAWEFRAEKAELERQELLLAEEAERKARVAEWLPKEAPRTVVKVRHEWADRNPQLNNVGALLHGYNAQRRTGYIATPFLPVEEPEHLKGRQNTAASFAYYYKEGDKTRDGVFVFHLESTSPAPRFQRASEVLVLINDEKLAVIKLKREESQDADRVRERISAEVSRSVLEKIVNGSGVVIRVGESNLTPTAGMHMLLYNLLQACS
jgi:endonuclease YncB( thermonuclease family)